MRKGRDGEKKNGGKNGKKGEKTDDYSGQYVIASSQLPERWPLERLTLVPIHYVTHIPNFQSLCALRVVTLQGVSKSSLKESKRTSVVPDWCQMASLKPGMFHIYIGGVVFQISSLYVHYKWNFSKESSECPSRSLGGHSWFLRIKRPQNT